MDPITKYLSAYLADKLSFASFQDWLIGSVDADSDDAHPHPQRKLLRDVELVVAEFTGGHISEYDLKASIRTHAGLDQTIVFPSSAPQYRTASASVIVELPQLQVAHG